jgi:GNAT superfamily N-acetyltransferase
MTQVKIERAAPSDLESVCLILEDASRWLRSQGTLYWPIPYPRTEALSRIERQETILAYLDQKPVGTMNLQLEEDAIWNPYPSGLAAYIHRLAVLRSHAGQGIGYQMLNWAEEEARSLRKLSLRLDCGASLDSLHRYYERAGFSCRGDVNQGHLRLRLYEKLL